MDRVFPSITTHGHTSSSWRSKIQEIENLSLPLVGLFLTGLESAERPALYASLKQLRKHHEFQIPFVHAVSTMRESEYWLLSEHFGTQTFNLHPIAQYPLQHDLSDRLREKIYIENARAMIPLTQEDLSGFAGVCLDVSHLEDTRRNSTEKFALMGELLEKTKIGANHISAVGKHPAESLPGWNVYSRHVAVGASEVEYLTQYPRSYFSDLCAIELENPLAEQLDIVKRVEEILASNERRAVGFSRAA